MPTFRDVRWKAEPQPSPAWLYKRGPDTVRIEVRDRGTAYVLAVCGPGQRERSIECQDPWAVIESQVAEEGHLLALGYSLERFHADSRHPSHRWAQWASRGKVPGGRERTRN